MLLLLLLLLVAWMGLRQVLKKKFERAYEIRFSLRFVSRLQSVSTRYPVLLLTSCIDASLTVSS
jgi:hypothetical protein